MKCVHYCMIFAVYMSGIHSTKTTPKPQETLSTEKYNAQLYVITGNPDKVGAMKYESRISGADSIMRFAARLPLGSLDYLLRNLSVTKTWVPIARDARYQKSILIKVNNPSDRYNQIFSEIDNSPAKGNSSKKEAIKIPNEAFTRTGLPQKGEINISTVGYVVLAKLTGDATGLPREIIFYSRDRALRNQKSQLQSLLQVLQSDEDLSANSDKEIVRTQ